MGPDDLGSNVDVRSEPAAYQSAPRLCRFALMTMLFVTLGGILPGAKPTLAQSTPEHLPSASEKAKDADLGSGKKPVANTISTSHHIDSTEDKDEETDKVGVSPWGPVPT